MTRQALPRFPSTQSTREKERTIGRIQVLRTPVMPRPVLEPIYVKEISLEAKLQDHDLQNPDLQNPEVGNFEEHTRAMPNTMMDVLFSDINDLNAVNKILEQTSAHVIEVNNGKVEQELEWINDDEILESRALEEKSVESYPSAENTFNNKSIQPDKYLPDNVLAEEVFVLPYDTAVKETPLFLQPKIAPWLFALLGAVAGGVISFLIL